ncbi:TIGR02647 family protein [Marinobacter zhejiangensis]|uniref:TIGR02647 family protein n=1 Tax=Marinobacter zhejiangensis TaxID=488535 RepID=A0A1I4Q5L2_9GAMM|nr:TIGR02647 family protein [Marinobacter zhejiangensis]SFM35361.1 TIGR02647 family protein [Marinobacter zhejiangensis]
MPFTSDQIAELKLLSQFNSCSSQEGIKVHQHTATPEVVAAAERLFQKGLITQHDGGYLTSRGCEAVEQTEQLLGMLADG